MKVEIFGIDVFLGFAVLGAALSLALWLWVTVNIKPFLVHGTLNTATVLLTNAAFIGIDLILLWGFALRPDPLQFRIVIAFVFGIQTTAALCALLSQRQRKARK